MSGRGLSLRTGNLDHWPGTVLPQQPPYGFMVRDDRLRAAGEQRVIRVQVDRGSNEIIVPALCRSIPGRRGTPVYVHEINRMACPCKCSAYLISAMDRIQYQDMHTKKI